MQTQDTLNRLDAQIESRSILRHPFYVAWQKGKLTREQLAMYARVYWPHVAAFPAYLESSAEVTADPTNRGIIERNLEDERSNPAPHPELWLDFAKALGQSREEVTSAPPHRAAAQMVATFDGLARSSTAEGIAALYAYESQQPGVASQKRDGLRAFYGLDTPQALVYFDVHAEADVAHSQGEREVLERCLEAGASPTVVLGAADAALDAYWSLLDGVCEEAGISTRCAG